MGGNLFIFVLGMIMLAYGLYYLCRLSGCAVVTAECTGSIVFYSDMLSDNAMRTFRYTYNGSEYESKERNLFGRKTKPGTKCRIFVNKKDPYEFFTAAQMVSCGFFFCVGVLAVFACLFL